MKACKNCKHFHSKGSNPNHVCFRPRPRTRFDPYNGTMEPENNIDIFQERMTGGTMYCTPSGQFWEAA